jgi:hypothetical protein
MNRAGKNKSRPWEKARKTGGNEKKRSEKHNFFRKLKKKGFFEK